MKINNEQKNKGPVSPSQGGFTLIELMVATSLFVVIMLAAMSSLFVLLNESKDSRALRVTMDNVNFAMESMTRSIRMGVNYSGGTNSISFKPQCDENSTSPCIENITYRLPLDGTPTIEKCTTIDVCVPIVSPDVNIDMLNFSINAPTTEDPLIQPSVYIMVKGTVRVNGVPTSFAIQTLASQRNF
jgi:prepilin-type N-terminal cleavage/methylation domain-containing protein